MVEQTLEVFLDGFSLFGESYDDFLHNLENVLKRCEETNLVLNWEKYHFIVQEGIILSHKGKIEVIDKLRPHTSVKGIRSFLGHAGFYRQFIKDFSKIPKPLCIFPEHDRPFNFDERCLNAFIELKRALVMALVVIVSDGSIPFELMCNTGDHFVGAVLGQRKDKFFTHLLYQQDFN